jgi:hypothetical protein
MHPAEWTDEAKARFWSKVGPANENGCRLWTGCLTARGGGYGRFQHDGKLWGAHRVVVELTAGPVPAGMVVCHRCDVPECCNPEHLYVGTHRDNSRDAMERKRNAHGESSGTSKLTDAAVAEARRRYRAGETGLALAAEYGVTQAAMWFALCGRTWKHVPGACPEIKYAGERSRTAKLTDALVADARAKKMAGAKLVDLVVEFGVSPMTLWNALVGNTWSHVPNPCPRGPFIPRERKEAA